ncbi:MAG: cytochrome c biogenesis protein transmembrane protein [Candidatus Gottesmanbacteria bacterium GW2011_GWA2_43_14]|uniref:Cytochrome c biogenesis protein transmembrane protein n=1 Tax=Candidatus Gottesmanbacteria bacterium GW2011_GWA2_43_14 TaxID=1618443 RepID=A0A0G1GGQ1_9BACT|nr:MAG: cytochrome c biogenesis protein transmembrane protein [Candidatus Gottesmanbacteria bacterium GW2011_GWA2_43_14]
MNLFFGVSLTASFLGGMVALFAPCCITFLFPSYLGTIFKDRKRVVFLTMIFAAGLGSILVPVALGASIIVSFFDKFHTTTYLLGALVMFLVGLMTLFEVKLMLPLPHYTMPKETTVLSTYILGLFSGITSSCCAPVLFAAITLSSLSPTLLSSLIVSIAYVLGIVFPLFFLSLFYEKLSNKYLYKIKSSWEKPLKILASVTFMVSAVIIALMALTGKIEMDKNMAYGESLRRFIFNLSNRLGNPLIDLLLIALLVIFIKIMIKEVGHGEKK